ncbi:MAG: hypothetical protein AAF513_15860 [Pseudomonadota bacterium]
MTSEVRDRIYQDDEGRLFLRVRGDDAGPFRSISEAEAYLEKQMRRWLPKSQRSAPSRAAAEPTPHLRKPTSA